MPWSKMQLLFVSRTEADICAHHYFVCQLCRRGDNPAMTTTVIVITLLNITSVVVEEFGAI